MPRCLALPALAALIAAGCTPAPPPSPTARANAAAVAACRSSTDQSFERQNRYLLSERDTTDAPYSTSGDSGITTRGLSQRYGYDVDLSNCLAAHGDNPNGPATSTQPPPPTGTPLLPAQ